MLISPLSGLSSPVRPRIVVELAIPRTGLISGLTGLVSTLTRLTNTLATSACGPKPSAHKGGRKFRANLRKLGKHNGLTPPFITNEFGQCRANPVNFANLADVVSFHMFWTYPRLLHPSLFASKACSSRHVRSKYRQA